MPSLMLVNPKKRRKRRKAKRRRNPIAKVNPRRRKRRKSPTRYRKRRRNPASRGVGGMVKNIIMPSATAAAGAIGLDIIMGYLPLPDAVKTGPMRHVVKGAAAIGLGMLAAQFVKRQTAEAIAGGALTVVMYGAGKELAMRFMPNLPLSAYEIDDDEFDLDGIDPDDLDLDGLGYYSAGYNPDSEVMGLSLEDDDDDDSLMAYEIDEDEGDLMGLGYVDEELEL